MASATRSTQRATEFERILNDFLGRAIDPNDPVRLAFQRAGIESFAMIADQYHDINILKYEDPKNPGNELGLDPYMKHMIKALILWYHKTCIRDKDWAKWEDLKPEVFHKYAANAVLERNPIFFDTDA